MVSPQFHSLLMYLDPRRRYLSLFQQERNSERVVPSFIVTDGDEVGLVLAMRLPYYRLTGTSVGEEVILRGGWQSMNALNCLPWGPLICLVG